MGVKTRAMSTALAEAAKRRRVAVSSPAQHRIAYLQLRSRSLVMTSPPRIARPGGKNSRSSNCGEILREAESNASCELLEVSDDSESVSCGHSSFKRKRETTSWGNLRDDLSDLDSTAGIQPSQRSAAAITPSDADVEEFFAAAEQKITQQFGTKYNFDVRNDLPLEGRYEWTKIRNLS